MAPPASYCTAQDVESLLQASAPTPTFPLRRAVFAGLVGFMCATGLLLVTNSTTLQAQPPVRPTISAPVSAPLAVVKSPSLLQKVGSGLAALSLTTMANLGTPYAPPALASELDVLTLPTPTAEYIFDDGSLLSKSTVGELSRRLPDIEQKTGYRINVVTLRKLTSSDDAFQFADNLIETWYPTAELGSKKAIFVIVKNSKEGGLVGGPSFSQTVPGSVIESIINDNVGKLLTQEKFNQAVTSTVSRLEAVLSGQADPGAPKMLFVSDKQQQSATYKTKDETESKRAVYGTVFGALVLISFVAPMVQFFGYIKDDE